MELKVWVEGIQRIVCGVTEVTTCQDVVFALAHATGKIGRFTLIEKWRNNERLLAPNENPLKILMKWGEYSSDVQFILQRSDQQQKNQLQQPVTNIKSIQSTNNVSTTAAVPTSVHILDRNKEIRKSFGLIQNTDEKLSPTQQQQQLQQQQQQQQQQQSENIGIVKGIQQTFIGSSITKSPPESPMLNETILSPILSKQQQQQQQPKSSPLIHQQSSSPMSPIFQQKNQSLPSQPQHSASSSLSSSIEFNSADIRDSLDRKTGGGGGGGGGGGANSGGVIGGGNNISGIGSGVGLFRKARNLSNENLLEAYNLQRLNNSAGTTNVGAAATTTTPATVAVDVYKNGPPISSNGALVPPPYRDPPPPRTSPLHQKSDSFSKMIMNNNNNNTNNNNNIKMQSPDNLNITSSSSSSIVNIRDMSIEPPNNEQTFQNAQYRELIQLIKYQREKLSTQQADLTKFDAEIVYLESKECDHIQQLEAIAREIGKTDQLFRQGQEQLQTLQYVEEENELVHQQEKTLKSEITLLRSKLANCETELLQCKNKIRLLMDDIQIEQQRSQLAANVAAAAAAAGVNINNITTNRQHQFIVENAHQQQQQQQQQQHQQQQQQQQQQHQRQQIERHFMGEVERIQSEIDQVIHNSESSTKTMDNLKKEVAIIETAIAEKKKQVEQLVNEMKEVNLQSLAVPPSDEIRHLLEGSNRPGSTRRIIGSPRQLETAVPTSKNPHGVWV